jgi:hypothetical protein
MDTEHVTKYSKYHRKYYNEHREEIREKRKVTDKAYYEKNKDAIKQRALARYYRLKNGNPPAPAESPAPAPAPDRPAPPASVTV